MTKDCFGTCPKCGEIGWCHYKGKARIFKSGPGSDLYKVSLFKCGNCGKKFGFELEEDSEDCKDNSATCDQCKYYEGVHNCPGHAPCGKRHMASVMYDTEACSMFEKYEDCKDDKNIYLNFSEKEMAKEFIKDVEVGMKKLNQEEDDDSEDWKMVCELLNSYPTIDAGYPNDPVTRAYIIARKHCGRDS